MSNLWRTSKSSTEEFIKRANKVHNNKYDYSKVEYKNIETKVCIICPEHGEFWQIPANHLRGQGCPKCNQSKLEREIIIKFTGFIKEQRFDWLKYNDYMRLDFFFPDYNIAIECQGEQHFKSIDRFGGENELQKRLFNDKLKYELCKQHNIEIIYYFPKRFMKHNISFYNDKKCFHNINDIIKYMNNKV